MEFTAAQLQRARAGKLPDGLEDALTAAWGIAVEALPP